MLKIMYIVSFPLSKGGGREGGAGGGAGEGEGEGEGKIYFGGWGDAYNF